MRAKSTSMSSASGKTDSMHRLVIGAPLLIIAVFCFGFFMMHSNGSTESRSSTTRNTAHKQAAPATKSADIQPVSTLPATDASNSSSENDNSGATANNSTGAASSDSGSQASSSPAQSNNPAAGSSAHDDTNNRPKATTPPNSTPASNNDGLLQTVVSGLFGNN